MNILENRETPSIKFKLFNIINIEIDWVFILYCMAGFFINLQKLIVYVYVHILAEKKPELTILEKIRSIYLPTVKSLYNGLYTVLYLLVNLGILSMNILEGWILKKISLYIVILDFIVFLLIKLKIKELLDQFSSKRLYDSLTQEESIIAYI